jgi:uncharacterized protein (DUF2342 family)
MCTQSRLARGTLPPLAQVTSRLLGFTRATLKRTGYASFRLHVTELAGVLDA